MAAQGGAAATGGGGGGGSSISTSSSSSRRSEGSEKILIARRYILGPRIGSGSFGEIFLCTDATRDDKEYAVKLEPVRTASVSDQRRLPSPLACSSPRTSRLAACISPTLRTLSLARAFGCSPARRRP
jgi:hypothetical protein